MNYKKQALFNSLGNVIYLASLWMLSIIITKTSGYNDAGIFSLAMTIGNVFFAFQMFGMRSYQVSDSSDEFGAEQYVKSRYLSCVFGIILCGLFLLFSKYTNKNKLIIMSFLLYKTLEAISDSYFGELQKKGKLVVLAKSMSFKGIFTFAIFTIFMLIKKDLLISMICIVVLASAITFFYDFNQYRKYVDNSKKYTYVQSICPLKKCFMLMVATIIPIVITAIPRLVLEAQYGTVELGYYGNISTPTVLITAVVPTILTPFMTLYGELIKNKEYKKLYTYFINSLIATTMFGLGMEIMFFVLGKKIMTLLFTASIVPYVKYMFSLIFVMIIYAFTMCCNSVLISLRRNNEVLIYTIVSLLACILFSFISVEKFGISGVIFTMGISYGLQFICQITNLYIKREK